MFLAVQGKLPLSNGRERSGSNRGTALTPAWQLTR